MSGISLVLELVRKNPNFHTSQALHSNGVFFSAAAAASAAAATSVVATAPFAARFLFGDLKVPVAHCDAATAWSEDYISEKKSTVGDVLHHDALKYSTKHYNIELKPLFSAFEPKTFAMTSFRSFLLFYLPLLEPRATLEEEDDDFLQDNQEERPVDLVVPFKKSVKQIIRESTVVTTRRFLERLAVAYLSQRMAWKLLKDVPKSATRKAQRGLPTYVYFWSVSRTTFRGHFLGVAASWFVQVGIHTYRCLSSIFNSKEEVDEVDPSEQVRILVRKVYGTTVKCGASLVFASVGAGIGATLFRPSLGQWIGCAAGDFAGPIIIAVCFDKLLHTEI